MPLEKVWLHRHVFKLSEVAQANAHQTEQLMGTEVNPLPQRQGYAGHLIARRRWGRRSMAAGEDSELACLQLQDYRARNA